MDSESQLNTVADEVLNLKKRVRALEKENEILKKNCSRWRLAEEAVAKITGGELTTYSCPFDILLKNGVRLEVKHSPLNRQKRTPTVRWIWSSPLGLKNKGKAYEFLILVGDKNPDHEYYPKDSSCAYPDFVFFIVPYSEVSACKGRGAMIALNTDFKTITAGNRTSKQLCGKLASWRDLEKLGL
jgi:hypothetical protein